MRDRQGPLYVIGRYRIENGRTTIGSGANCTICLPDRAPALLGTVDPTDGHVTFEPPRSASLTRNGKPVAGIKSLQTEKDPLDTLQSGDFSLIFHAVKDGVSLYVQR